MSTSCAFTTRGARQGGDGGAIGDWLLGVLLAMRSSRLSDLAPWSEQFSWEVSRGRSPFGSCADRGVNTTCINIRSGWLSHGFVRLLFASLPHSCSLFCFTELPQLLGSTTAPAPLSAPAPTGKRQRHYQQHHRQRNRQQQTQPQAQQ